MYASRAIDNATDTFTYGKNVVLPVHCSSAQQGNVTGYEGSASSVAMLNTDTFMLVDRKSVV